VLGHLASKIAVVRYRFWSAITGADIPLNIRSLGGGLELPHPNGIVIRPDATIGPNCRPFQQVTLGTGSRPGLTTLGAPVDIGAGAKILGGVHIGDFAIIGANAVVVSDIPAGATAVGIPAVAKPHARDQWDRQSRTERIEQNGLRPLIASAAATRRQDPDGGPKPVFDVEWRCLLRQRDPGQARTSYPAKTGGSRFTLARFDGWRAPVRRWVTRAATKAR
jgi:serine O-acetyltransferase